MVNRGTEVSLERYVYNVGVIIVASMVSIPPGLELVLDNFSLSSVVLNLGLLSLLFL
jgi:hypothetical protein